jgi:hypothetical protein
MHSWMTSSLEEEEEVEGEGEDLRSEIRMRSNFWGSMVPPTPPMANSEDAGRRRGATGLRRFGRTI